jgi:hypothetical protein
MSDKNYSFDTSDLEKVSEYLFADLMDKPHGQVCALAITLNTTNIWIGETVKAAIGVVLKKLGRNG